MARKRMISPEIWESQSFGELSILAKILFIGMISQADDDGKGILSAQLLKSRILPFDELRIADIDKALNEIGHNVSVADSADTDKALNERGHKLSVVFYEVEGKSYYLFENWRKWQTINRPIPSKLPNPPVADGEGGGVHSHEEITHNSMSTHEQLNEYSRAIEDIEESNIPPTSAGACAREEESEFQQKFKAFCQEFDITNDNCYSPRLVAFDFDKLQTAYLESTTLLMDKDRAPYAHTLSWVCKNYDSIIAGKYKDSVSKLFEAKHGARQSAHERGTEILKTLYEESAREENDGT